MSSATRKKLDTEKRSAPRKRGRPRRGSTRALDRDRILATALEIAKVDGLEQLSMRRLASTLEVDSASLYWHFPNKQSLLTAALERAGLEITLEVPPDGPWRERCTSFCNDLRDLLREQPHLLQIQDQASILTPLVVHASRILIEILATTGLRGEPLVLSAQGLLWQALGMARLELNSSDSPPSAHAVDEVRRSAVPAATAGLDQNEWQDVANAYTRLSFERLFDFAIESALDAIEHRLAMPNRQATRSERSSTGKDIRDA